MNDFEEKYVRWLDAGKPTDDAAFLRELERRGGSAREQEEWAKLSTVFGSYAAAQKLENADFFKHGILEKIEAEQAKQNQPARKSTPWLFRLPRMAWAGFALVAAAVVLFFSIPGMRHTPIQPDIATRILSANAEQPGLSIAAFEAGEGEGAVVWIDGLDYLPADHAVR